MCHQSLHMVNTLCRVWAMSSPMPRERDSRCESPRSCEEWGRCCCMYDNVLHAKRSKSKILKKYLTLKQASMRWKVSVHVVWYGHTFCIFYHVTDGTFLVTSTILHQMFATAMITGRYHCLWEYDQLLQAQDLLMLGSRRNFTAWL